MDGETGSGPAAAVLSLKNPVDVSLQDEVEGLGGEKLWRGPGPCWGRGCGADGLELVDGVTGHDVRTVPLYIKATVELVQVVA